MPLPHQPTDSNSHLQELVDKPAETIHYNYTSYSTQNGRQECTFQTLRQNAENRGSIAIFPITLDQAIVMLTAVTTHNIKLRNKIIMQTRPLGLNMQDGGN